MHKLRNIFYKSDNKNENLQTYWGMKHFLWFAQSDKLRSCIKYCLSNMNSMSYKHGIVVVLHLSLLVKLTPLTLKAQPKYFSNNQGSINFDSYNKK